MGGMALFVGGYLIYNTFSMTVVERTREFGLLRTLGLTQQQVIVQVLVEAGILGIMGSLIGAIVGNRTWHKVPHTCWRICWTWIRSH